MKEEIRPLEHLNAASKLYPETWKQVDIFRSGRGVDWPNWPDWCFLPMSATYAIVSEGGDMSPHLVGDVANLSALIAWRYTQGIYRFEPHVYESISNTVVDKEIPVEVLFRLPEWGVYIETPQLDCYGFFAHLEYDTNTGRAELRLLIDDDTMLFPIILHLGDWTVTEAIDRSISESAKQGEFNKYDLPVAVGSLVTRLSEIAHHCISLLLYLCSEQPDIERIENELPGKPKPKKVKKGMKLFPPSKPKIWHVGQTIAKSLNREPSEAAETGRSHSSPKAHIRRAHWHGYWTGKKGTQGRSFIYKWLPPQVINAKN